MSSRPNHPSLSDVSFKISLADRAGASAIADSVKASIGRGAKSVVLTVRGARSAMVSLLDSLQEHPTDVSAVLTIRGDKPGI